MFVSSAPVSLGSRIGSARALGWFETLGKAQ